MVSLQGNLYRFVLCCKLTLGKRAKESEMMGLAFEVMGRQVEFAVMLGDYIIGAQYKLVN